jgi:hypothetical protein
MGTESGPSLDRIQRWMQACILHQGSCEEAIGSEAAQAAIPVRQGRELVLPSATLSAFERLDVYREMYLLRMQEALEIDYPALAHYLGAEAFAKMVERYVEAHPSRSYTLNRLGDHLPEFLATYAGAPKPEFCRQLARLELALTEVFDEAETPVLSAEAIAAVPVDAWERARLKPVAAFRLIESSYPVSEYLAAVDDETAAPPIRKRTTWVAAYRRNFRVHRMDLKRPAYALLSLLAEGNTVGDAVSTVLLSQKVRETQLFEWFRDWVSEGLFHAVELA